MELRQLRYFVGIAELGSFTKAALVLDIAQPALSRQIRELETELGVPLLVRNGRGALLTDAGREIPRPREDDPGRYRTRPSGGTIV